MGILRETSRTPNYYGDIEFGKCAETDFENYMSSNYNYKIFDVRLVREYQNSDIDYVITKKDIIALPSFDEVIKNIEYIKIEVKLDSRGLNTGNFPYEVVSHGSSGWCVTTKSDLVYLVLTRRDTQAIERRAWIYMNKWHEYCADRNVSKRSNYIQNENIFDLLCNMDDMVARGVMRWI